jgi:adenine deaminase
MSDPDSGVPSGPADRFNVQDWRRRLVAARGTSQADLVIAGGHVLNVFTGELEETNVAIVGKRIAGVGNYSRAKAYIDARGKVVAPSFIDPHIHVESSMVWLPEFARAVVPRGTGAVVTDPHEMANVAGLPGLIAMREAAKRLPLTIRFTAPSCVPASAWESPGARFGVEEISEMLTWPETVGLGELMNFPGALSGDNQIGRKLVAATGKRRDGHAPGLKSRSLQAYLATGVTSDHESTELDEARQKLRAGLMIMIREGTTEHNLEDLLPLVDDFTFPRCTFCSDDRDCHTLLHDGHIDAILRKAISLGLDPVMAIRMATWNAADYWRLDGIGAVAPGYFANLILLDDLRAVSVKTTIHEGEVVAQDGALVVDLEAEEPPSFLTGSVHLAPLTESDFRLDPKKATEAVVAIPGQIVTGKERVEPRIENDSAIADPEQDLLKLACVERHHATGRVGVGYIMGFGLRRGALASSIAHDAHNIIAIGAKDSDILRAIEAVAEMQGGLAVVAGGEVLGRLPLPIAGLLSDRPLHEVAESFEQLEGTARGLGSSLPSPFGLLTFMALSVIPAARVTDRGFVTVG